ncbi:MAG: tRNA (N6-isopentenyl adenosine(37)-C2)-methylthiotransferase MiaB [Gemmatimonadota bacterium]|nr:MAG: tRNA (N6-isopentenyl adenosine(37)-C2)-methylthiotransferase MiaB [Gemmatimonadota bacterium]
MGRSAGGGWLKYLYVETYGCQMNVADTELLFGVLGKEGYAPTDEPSKADVMLVNTCAVRDNAEQRVIGRLGELKRFKRPGVVLGTVGCMAQRLGQQLLEDVPHVDLVIGPDGYRALPDLIEGALAGDRAADVDFKTWEHYEDIAPQREIGSKAFVTIQRGCDYRCTFCIVPMTRGRERSRKLSDVLAEVESLARRGVSEITLLGQTVNSYNDGERDFADMLYEVGAVAGIRRVRFTSPHPNDFSNRVIEAMAAVPTVCEHVHLPVQSGSSRVLKLMGRKYDREGYLRCVEQLRRSIPDIAISTDIIVGFPGETEAEFLETESLVREVGFDDAFTFKYSQRDGTGAVRLPDQVPEEVKGERLERIISTVREVACSRNMGLIGVKVEVLAEGMARRGELIQSRTRGNKVVLIDGPAELIGSYLTVRLTGTTGATFTGVPTPTGKELAIVG